MTRWRRRLAFVLALVAFVTSACGSGSGGDTSSATADEGPIPTGIPLLDGGEMALGAGRPTVVAFVAEWCTPCRRELPLIESVYQNHLGDIDVVAAGFQEDESSTRRLAEETGITFDLGSDPEGDLFRDFGFVQLPATVVVGADGEVVERFASGVDDVELEAALEPIL